MSVTQYSRQLDWVDGRELLEAGVAKEELLAPGRVFLWQGGSVGYHPFRGMSFPVIPAATLEKRPPVFIRLPLKGSLLVVRQSGQGRTDNDLSMLPSQFLQPAADGHNLSRGVQNYFGRYVEYGNACYLTHKLVPRDAVKKEDWRRTPAKRVLQAARATLQDFPIELVSRSEVAYDIRNLRAWLSAELRMLALTLPHIDGDGFITISAGALSQICYDTSPPVHMYTEEEMHQWRDELLEGSIDDLEWTRFTTTFDMAPTA